MISNCANPVDSELTLEKLQKLANKLPPPIEKDPFVAILREKGVGPEEKIHLFIPENLFEKEPELLQYAQKKWITICPVIGDSILIYRGSVPESGLLGSF